MSAPVAPLSSSSEYSIRLLYYRLYWRPCFSAACDKFILTLLDLVLYLSRIGADISTAGPIGGSLKTANSHPERSEGYRGGRANHASPRCFATLNMTKIHFRTASVSFYMTKLLNMAFLPGRIECIFTDFCPLLSRFTLKNGLFKEKIRLFLQNESPGSVPRREIEAENALFPLSCPPVRFFPDNGVNLAMYPGFRNECNFFSRLLAPVLGYILLPPLSVHGEGPGVRS